MLGAAIDAGAVAGHPVALVGPLVAGVADHGARLHALELALSVRAAAELRGQRGDDGQLSGVYGQLVDGGPRLPVVCRFCVKTRPDSMVLAPSLGIDPRPAPRAGETVL